METLWKPYGNLMETLWKPYGNLMETLWKPHNLYKLITKEDSTHIHKFFGFSCLIHFLYRYSLLLTKGTMNFVTDPNYLSLVLVLGHGVLSCSSMIFHISSVRNKNAPMIYPEFRLHSILFALRSIVCFCFTFYQFPVMYKMATCFVTMLLADVVTKKWGNQQRSGTTMRSMPLGSEFSEEDQKKIAFLQSKSQVHATLYMLHNLETCFSPLFAIQLAAFLMTLVRKSIITSRMWHIVYNFSLWINVFCFTPFFISNADFLYNFY
jgi:hypothetical protein